MDQHEFLAKALADLRRVVESLDGSEMDSPTNCPPWTVRQLASHALNNQLLWGGVVSGQALVTVEQTMGAVAHEGDLTTFADDVVSRTLAMWDSEGVLDAVHATPFGELPGAVVIDFPTVDALAHAWDLSASVGRPIEFSPEMLPAISSLVDRVCTEPVRASGLIAAAQDPPADATETERLMAFAGRSIPRER
jgi:uncharacterized protein (TIGR03086 family)